MRRIAKGFVLALTTATKGNNCSPSEVVLVSKRVVDFEVPFDSEGSIVFRRNFCRHEVLERRDRILG